MFEKLGRSWLTVKRHRGNWVEAEEMEGDETKSEKTGGKKNFKSGTMKGRSS